MAHLVAGYPDLDTNEVMLKLMQNYGISHVEIQLPFSDPIADGSTIVFANQQALESGISIDKIFKWIEKMSSRFDIPLICMTYANIVYRKGLEKFIKNVKDSGAKAVIVPDLSMDEEEGQNFHNLCQKYDIGNILVVSPNISDSRLAYLSQYFNYLVYCTLKIGITGQSFSKDQKSLTLIEKLKKQTSIPIAAGFGIRDSSDVYFLKEHADIVVIGSHLIRLLKQGGMKALESFFKKIQF